MFGGNKYLSSHIITRPERYRIQGNNITLRVLGIPVTFADHNVQQFKFDQIWSTINGLETVDEKQSMII